MLCFLVFNQVSFWSIGDWHFCCDAQNNAGFSDRSMNRRRFLKRTFQVSAAAAVSLEERALLTRAQDEASDRPASTPSQGPMPTGRLGHLNVSRLICGGNLISGFAHSRDLLFVSPLLKRYFTDEKVFETLARCEALGVNTAILRVDDDTLRIITRYRRERGGRIQWIAQAKATETDLTSDAQRAIDNGAVGVYLHGGVCDGFVSAGQTDQIGRVLEFVRRQRVLAGVAGHDVAVPIECEKVGLKPDFYVKTHNSKSYWSAGPLPRHDSVWEETPEETRSFMRTVQRPWIAYKVLGAGAIHPREGFTYAFQSGADFLCVGMFDFQIDEDVVLARAAFTAAKDRQRPWCA